MSPHGIFPCKGKDQWVSIAVGSEKEWAALCRAIGRGELQEDPRFSSAPSRKKEEKALEEILVQWTRERDRMECAEILQREGVAAFPVYCIHETDVDPHFVSLPLLKQEDHPEYGKGMIYTTPWRFNQMKGDIGLTPLMGQHNDYVFKGLLGLADDRYKELVEKKVIY
jgi:benzylsuccinate CoA-transferase BbsF subunit